MKFIVNYVCLATLISIGVAPMGAIAGTNAVTAKVAVQTPKTAELIRSLKDKLATCSAEFDKFASEYRTMRRATDLLNMTEERLADAQGTVTVYSQMREISPYHKLCIDSAKSDQIPEAKTFIQALKPLSNQKAAKDMVAQWITALDAIGGDGASSERSKFETLANGLLLDL